MGSREFPSAREALDYLQERITERKVHDRRQKILDGIQLIRNRRKLEFVIPVRGQDQEMWFKKLEANGIWKRVFAFVTNTSDVTSAYLACDLFKKHLEEKRKMMHLSEVLGVLRDTGHLKYSVDIFMDSNLEIVTENKNVLNLRQVSHAWKRAAVEQFLVVPLGFSQPDWHLRCTELKMNSVGDTNFICPIQCLFAYVWDIDNAMEVLRTSTSCSPLLRTIFVADEFCGDKETFYSKLGHFLDIHGRSVWGLEFRQETDFNYEGLWSLVSRMPNLKAMSLLYDREDWVTNANFDVEGANAQFLRMMARMPFPSIRSLKVLKFSGFPVFGDLLFAEIVGKNAGLKTVSFEVWKRNDPGSFFMSDSVWDALSTLRLEHFGWTLIGFGFGLPQNIFLERILQMRGFDWPLKVFHVYHALIRGHDFTLGTFFEVLNRFSRTLVKVSAKSASHSRPLFSDDVDDGACVIENFPNLRKIDVLPVPEIGNYE